MRLLVDTTTLGRLSAEALVVDGVLIPGDLLLLFLQSERR